MNLCNTHYAGCSAAIDDHPLFNAFPSQALRFNFTFVVQNNEKLLVLASVMRGDIFSRLKRSRIYWTLFLKFEDSFNLVRSIL